MTTDEKFVAMFLHAKEAFDEEYPPGSARREHIEKVLAERELHWERMERLEALARNMGKAARMLRRRK